MGVSRDISTLLFQALMECKEQGVQITLMPVFFEQRTGQIAIDHVGDKWNVRSASIRWGQSCMSMSVAARAAGSLSCRWFVMGSRIEMPGARRRMIPASPASVASAEDAAK